MFIEIRCNSCDKVLAVLNKTIVPGTDTVRLEVKPCGGIDCKDCRDCEDMEFLKQVQQELEEVKVKLATAFEVLK